MKIKAKWVISYSEGYATFDLYELNCQNEEEWNNLPETEKIKRLQLCIDQLPEKPSLILDEYKIIN